MLSDIRVTVRDLASAAVLVREGLGVSICPNQPCRKTSAACACCVCSRARYRDFGLVCSHSAQESAPVQAFLREL
jgi:DNA-binding transcriptional LysR family regulator